MNATTPAKAPIIAPANIQAQINDLVRATIDWITSHWLQVAIAIAIAAIIVVALTTLRRLANRLCRPGAGLSWSTILGRAISRTTNFFIVMLAAKLVDGYAFAPAEVTGTINFLFTIAAGFQSAVWAREIIIGFVEHRTQSETYRGETIANALGIIRLLVTIVVFSVAIIVVLGNLGVNVTGLVAGLGIGGIAIGLAAQGIFADLFAALSIIFDRPFSRGDAISYDATSGSVESIGLKSTRIRSVTGEERIISNKNLLDKEIINNSRREHRRITFAIGATYQTPGDKLAAMHDMLKQVTEAEGALFVRAGFTGFGASSLDFSVEFDCPADYQTAYDLRTRVGLAILKRLNDEAIDIAYPTQTTFTAAPDGTMVMPYAGPHPA